MKTRTIICLVIFLMLFFVVGCETLQKEIKLREAPAEEDEEPKEEVQAEQLAEEPPAEEETAPEQETAPEETTPLAEEPEETPEPPEETIPKIPETTTLTITPETVKPTELITIKVTPNKEYGYKTTIKIYDANEEQVKQTYISGCGNICKKEKSTTFKTEYDWKGDYCARVIDMETNKEVGECFEVE